MGVGTSEVVKELELELGTTEVDDDVNALDVEDKELDMLKDDELGKLDDAEL